MRVRRFLRITLAVLAAILACLAILGASVWAYFHPDIQRVSGLVYVGVSMAWDIRRFADWFDQYLRARPG